MALAFNVFGQPPSDPIVVQLVQFLRKHAHDKHIEFEGKIGSLCNTSGGRFGVTASSSPVLLAPGSLSGTYFKSELPALVFQDLNAKLNSRYKAMKTTETPIEYSSSHTIDRVFNVPNEKSAKLRISVDPRTEEVIADSQMMKVKLDDLQLSMNPHLFDLRISANSERPVSMSSIASQQCVCERRKQRMSYKFGVFRIDITSVTTRNPKFQQWTDVASKPTFEVEMEVVEIARLREEVDKANLNAPNELYSIAKSLFENLGSIVEFVSASQKHHLHQEQERARAVPEVPPPAPQPVAAVPRSQTAHDLMQNWLPPAPANRPVAAPAVKAPVKTTTTVTNSSVPSSSPSTSVSHSAPALGQTSNATVNGLQVQIRVPVRADQSGPDQVAPQAAVAQSTTVVAEPKPAVQRRKIPKRKRADSDSNDEFTETDSVNTSNVRAPSSRARSSKAVSDDFVEDFVDEDS